MMLDLVNYDLALEPPVSKPRKKRAQASHSETSGGQGSSHRGKSVKRKLVPADCTGG